MPLKDTKIRLGDFTVYFTEPLSKSGQRHIPVKTEGWLQEYYWEIN